MKKIDKGLEIKYPILRLYKKDIEQIADVFKQNFKKFEIIVDGYKLDDISEINNIEKQEIVDFKISSSYDSNVPSSFDQHLSLNLSGILARLEISDEDDVRLRGIAAKIDSILSQRKSILRLFVSIWMLVPLNLMLWVVIWLFPFKQYTSQGIMLLIFIVLFIIIWLIWSWKISIIHSVISNCA